MLEWIPDRPALCRGESCTVDVLVRITPVAETREEPRPDLNLTLVIDRSGSMAGRKIELTQEAASLAVRSLRAADQLSIVLFDDQIDVLWPAAPVERRDTVLELIREQVLARGSTALFDGWSRGAEQGLSKLDDRRLNRVILLTDGQANVGETRPDRICDQVHQKSQRGLQTTTMGFGAGYNEDLLRSMAASGGGNHFFVETPEQLTRFFELELEALAATVGTRVFLRLVPVPGVTVEPLGEVQLTPDGAYGLADLVAGYPLEQLFRITVPPQDDGAPPVSAELSWHSPRSGQEFLWKVPLSLARVSKEERMAMPVHPEVERQLAVAMAARARREAMAAMNRGDRSEATRILSGALETVSLPELERSQLQQLQQTVDRGDQSASNKMAAAQSYGYSRGSVSMVALDEMIVENLCQSGQLPLRHGPFMRSGPPAADRPWKRAEGMLQGLFAGEARGRPAGSPRGEASALSLATLSLITGSNKMIAIVPAMIKVLVDAPVADPSESLLALRSKGKKVWGGTGGPDCGALRRLPPLLLCRWGSRPGGAAACFVALGAHFTHDDAASAASCMAYAALLWDLMAMTDPPSPDFYLNRFQEVLGELEVDKTYPAHTPRFDGWEGRLSEFLSLAIPEARRRGLSAGAAHKEWGSGSYLLEAVPTLLYILECHGHEPGKALRAATRGTGDRASLGAVVGAALGALHGPQPDWKIEDDQVQAIAALRQRLRVD
ncbi:MAG: ADP-ribosylglycohydrolase family protein [Armatimonadetes bacterium]|nr:ADP-ribosylglycohydrolase family protein [Armatimonadota bacterium]